MSHDDNLTDKLEADARKATDKAHQEGNAAREKLEDAEAKLKADVHEHAQD